MRWLAVTSFGLALAAPAAGSPSSEAEALIAARVDAGVPSSLALLERLVNVNSGSENAAGVRAVGDALRGEFDALGFETRWIPGEGFGRAGHLVAERDGGGPRLLLIGHLDTVFEPASSFQRFERVDEWTARGPGLIDMKGGDVILLLALRALEDVGQLDDMSISVIMTGDEEDPGEPLDAARATLIELAERAQFAIGFEDGDGKPETAVSARRGSGDWQVEASGVRAHSSLIHRDDVGSGAIFELARILTAFHELREPHLTLSPGLLLGGSSVEVEAEPTRGASFGKTNVVAEHAFARGDLRPFSLEQRAAVQQRMREIVNAHLPRTDAQIRFGDSYPPMGPTSGNERLLALLDGVSRDLGLGGVTAAHLGQLGAADVSFAAPHVRAAIDGLGLGGEGGHTVHERGDLRTLPLQAKRAAVLMLRLSQGAFDE